MPIATVNSPHFEDFTNPVESPTAKTHHLLAMIRQIRQASPTAYFIGKLNLASNKRILESPMMNSFYTRLCFLTTNRKTKGERRRLGPGIITGGFVGEI